jgi:hypothetical protein
MTATATQEKRTPIDEGRLETSYTEPWATWPPRRLVRSLSRAIDAVYFDAMANERRPPHRRRAC